MDQTLRQLGGLLFNSIPTIIVFALLHFYLRRVLYRPLRATLSARAERIEGRLAGAQRMVAAAEQKLAGYEEAIRGARMDSYRQVEGRRQAALAAGQERMREARHAAASELVHARQQLAGETAQARERLSSSADAMAAQIVGHVLGGMRQPASGVPRVGA